MKSSLLINNWLDAANITNWCDAMIDLVEVVTETRQKFFDKLDLTFQCDIEHWNKFKPWWKKRSKKSEQFLYSKTIR